MNDILYRDHNYKFTIVNYMLGENIIHSESISTFNSKTINLNIPSGYTLAESPIINIGEENTVRLQRNIVNTTILFKNITTGEIIHTQSFSGYIGEEINKSSITLPYGYTITNKNPIILDNNKVRYIDVDNNIIPWMPLNTTSVLHKVNVKFMFNETEVSSSIISVRGKRKPIITIPNGYKAKTSRYLDGWNPSKPEFIIEVIPKNQRINIEVRDKRNNVVIRNISKDVPYGIEFNPSWVTNVIPGFTVDDNGYDHEIIHSSGNFVVYGELEQYWSINVPFKENITGDLKDDINSPEITFQKNDMINSSKFKIKKMTAWKYPNQLSSSTNSLLGIHSSNNAVDINNLIKEIRSDNIDSLPTVINILSDKDMRVKVNKVMKNDMFLNRIVDVNTYNKIDLFQLEEYTYNSMEDYNVLDILENINAYNKMYLEYTMKFPFGYMLTNIKDTSKYQSIIEDIIFYNDASNSTSIVKFDISTYNNLISKLHEYIDMIINLKTNVADGYTSPHLILHEDIIAIANGRIIRDIQNVQSNVNNTTIPNYIGMNSYGRLNANISKLRLAILNEDIYGLIVNRFKFRKSDLPNDHGLDANFTWVYDDYGYMTWENATKIIQLVQDIYNLSGNLTITEGTKEVNELVTIQELNVESYDKTLMRKIYNLFYHNMDNMVTTILAEEIKNHILENNAVNSLKYSWNRLKLNLPKLMDKFNNDYEYITASSFKRIVYPFFALFEIMYNVGDSDYKYNTIYKDYSYYRNESKKTLWLTKEDNILIRNIMKDIGKVITLFRKYYKGVGTDEFYKNVIEKVCHTPLSIKDIQSFNGIPAIDNIAKLNRSSTYRPAVYLDEIYPDNLPIKQLAWFGSKSLRVDDHNTYMYFINDARFDNIYSTPSHTWTDLVIDQDVALDDSNIEWYVDPVDTVEVKKTRFLTLEERLFKLINKTIKNNSSFLNKYIHLINNFYSSAEDNLKLGWHKVHLRNINLDDRLIRSMGSFIDIHTKLQHIKSDINTITDTTKPYTFSNTMSIEDNSSDYINTKIEWKDKNDIPKIKCSLYAYYEGNLHIAKVECIKDGIPLRVSTTVYGDRNCKPVFIAPANSDSTLVIKSGVDFTLCCNTAMLIASKITNANINEYDKIHVLDTKYNGDIIINKTGDTPLDKTVIWGSNGNKTIYSKIETVGEIIEDNISTPEFTDLLVEYVYKNEVLTPKYPLTTVLEKRNIIAKKRFWNDDYKEKFAIDIVGQYIRKKNYININVENNDNVIYNDTFIYKDITSSPEPISVMVTPHTLHNKLFKFTSTFVNKNNKPLPETDKMSVSKEVETTVSGRLNFKWTKRHPESLRYIPLRNKNFWMLNSNYYIEVIDSNNNVYTKTGVVTNDDISNGYIELNIDRMPTGEVISTFVIQEPNKFRSVANIIKYEQLEVLPDENFIVHNIDVKVTDEFMNREILDGLIEYEHSILNKNVIKGENLPLILPPKVNIVVDTLAPFVRIKIHPTDNENLLWEFSFVQDRLSYKYNHKNPDILINENTAKDVYDFIKVIGSYSNYDNKIEMFYDENNTKFIAKPTQTYKIIVEACDFDGTELNTYEFNKVFIDNHITNVSNSIFLKNSIDNTFLPNSISYPDGNEKLIWLYNNIDKPLITHTKIFGVTKNNDAITSLENYDTISNNEYIDFSTMERISYGEFVKWTVDTATGFPALESHETYLRDERISPSLLTADLDVSLEPKNRTEDEDSGDEADYFVNVTFTHKYIKDENTKIAVQLYRVYENSEKKIDTKVMTYGEYVKNQIISFPITDDTENSATYKTKIYLVNNIEVNHTEDNIDLLDVPRNTIEYTEVFERTVQPFFNKSPEDIMVLSENKIHIMKAEGVSYSIGSFGYLNIYDRDNKALVTKDIRINAEDVNKGEVVFELDKDIPQVFTFHINMQEPGKLPGIVYVTSAFLAYWKIEKPQFKTKTKIIDINFTNDLQGRALHARYKITYKEYNIGTASKPECMFTINDLVNKNVGWKTNVSEDVEIERIPLPVIETNGLIEYNHEEYTNNQIYIHEQVESYSYNTDISIYTHIAQPIYVNGLEIDVKGIGYLDMEHNSTDTIIPSATPVDLLSYIENVNNKYTADEGKYVMIFPINMYTLNNNRNESVTYKLIYGYKMDKGIPKEVSGSVTLEYGRWITDKLNTHVIIDDLWKLNPGDKSINVIPGTAIRVGTTAINTNFKVTNVVKPSRADIEAINGVTNADFMTNVSYFWKENMDTSYNPAIKNWYVVPNNLSVNKNDVKLFNMIVPYKNYDDKKDQINLPGTQLDILVNNRTLVAILKPITESINWKDIYDFQNGFDLVEKSIRFILGYDANNGRMSENFYRFKYKKYKDGRKARATIFELATHKSSFNNDVIINDDIYIPEIMPIASWDNPPDIVGYKPEYKAIREIISNDIYGWIKDETKVKHDIILDNTWNNKEMPRTFKNIPIDHMLIPLVQNWEALAFKNNYDIIVDDIPDNTTFYAISSDFRGHYLDELYEDWNSANIKTLTINCVIDPIKVYFECKGSTPNGANDMGYKEFTPTKTITLVKKFPINTNITETSLDALFTYNKNDLRIVSNAENNFTLTDNKTVTIHYKYIGKYSNQNYPFKLRPHTYNEIIDNIVITENDNFIKINDGSDIVASNPFNIISKLLIEGKGLNLTYKNYELPSIEELPSSDNKFTKLDEFYSSDSRLPKIDATVTLNGSALNLHWNDTYSAYLNSNKFDYTITQSANNQDLSSYKLNNTYIVRDYTGTDMGVNFRYEVKDTVFHAKPTKILKSSKSTVDEAYTKANYKKNKIKLLFENSNTIDTVYVYLVIGNEVIYNKQAFKVTNENKTNGFILIPLPSKKKLRGIINIATISQGLSNETNFYALSELYKHQFTIEGDGSSDSIQISVIFHINDRVLKAKQYKAISGLVGDNYDYRDEWHDNNLLEYRNISIFNSYAIEFKNDIRDYHYESTTYNLEVNDYEGYAHIYSLSDCDVLDASMLTLPAGFKLTKPGWLNNETKEYVFSLHENDRTENRQYYKVKIDISFDTDALQNLKFEYREEVIVNMTNMIINHNGRAITAQNDNDNDNSIEHHFIKVIEGDFNSANTIYRNDELPVELRFFIYDNAANQKKFNALYVWIPYEKLSDPTIKDYSFVDLLNNIDKFEHKLVSQEYGVNNMFKPVTPTVVENKFNGLLPSDAALEIFTKDSENSDPTLKVVGKDLSIELLKSIANSKFNEVTDNALGVSSNHFFIVPEIQRYITTDGNNNGQYIAAPIVYNSKYNIYMSKSLKLDQLKSALINYNRFVEEDEYVDYGNSRYQLTFVKNYQAIVHARAGLSPYIFITNSYSKYVVEYVYICNAVKTIDKNPLNLRGFKFDITLSDSEARQTNFKKYIRNITKSPWLYPGTIPTCRKDGSIIFSNPHRSIITVPKIELLSFKNIAQTSFKSIVQELFKDPDSLKTLMDILVEFEPELNNFKSRITSDILYQSLIDVLSLKFIRPSGNIYEPYIDGDPINLSSATEDKYISELMIKFGIFGYIYNNPDDKLKNPSIPKNIQDISKLTHITMNLHINSHKLLNKIKTSFRSTGRSYNNVMYLPNHTNNYNSIADGSGYKFNTTKDAKFKTLYEIPTVVDDEYLNKFKNHYIINLADIKIDWEFISGSHEVMMQDLINIQNIYNPTELGLNTKCTINITEDKLNDKLKTIFPEYKGNTLSDFNMLDYIDKITYKDTDKVVPKISLIETYTLEPGEFSLHGKTNTYKIQSSKFNSSNFFFKLDIATNLKYKFDISNSDRSILDKAINNISLYVVVDKKTNNAYEFKDITDLTYDRNKSKLFILKSKKFNNMEKVATEFDKKWIISKFNDNLITKIDKLLKNKSTPDSLKIILETIKNSNKPIHEWFVNGYNHNILNNDNIILYSDYELKGSTLMNSLISNIDYNYSIKNDMYLSVVKPLELSVDLNIIPSNSWKLEYIHNNNVLHSEYMLSEPSIEVIKNKWDTIRTNEDLTIYKDSELNMYTNNIKKVVSVFATDILEKHTLTIIFKANTFSKEQRIFNITKYANSSFSEDEFWKIFNSSNIHTYFSTNVPNIIKYYDFTYDITVVVNINTLKNKPLEDIPDIYYGANVNIKIGSNIISKTYYLPNNETISYKDIYNDLIVPLNIEHYTNNNIKHVYYTFKTYDKIIKINDMVNINIESGITTDSSNVKVLFNSNEYPTIKHSVTYDVPIRNTDNVTRLLNSINEYSVEHNRFITNIGDTSIDIESRYARFFNLPDSTLDIYYSEPLKQVMRRLSLLDDTKLEELSPRLNDIRKRAIIGNTPVTPSSVNIEDTTNTIVKAIDVHNINITATDVNIYLNLPAFYDICYAINYEPGDMLTLVRPITDFNIENKVKLSFKRDDLVNNSRILIAHFVEDNPVVNPLIIDVANSSYTLAGNTVNITSSTDIVEHTKALKIRGMIKMNDKTMPDIKRVKNSGLWLKQVSAIYDEYSDSNVDIIEDFYPLFNTTTNPSKTIALVDNNTNIAYARTSNAKCIVFRDGTEFYPIDNDISALKILTSDGVFKIY